MIKKVVKISLEITVGDALKFELKLGRYMRKFFEIECT